MSEYKNLGRSRLIAEIERLESFKAACMEWSDKTEWVQKSAHWSELGKHRADVIKDRLEALIAENESLRANSEKWKIVEHAMESLKSDERNASIWTVCSRLLISTAHKINSSTSTIVEEGVTIGDLEIGDWRVTVERISSPENPS